MLLHALRCAPTKEMKNTGQRVPILKSSLRLTVLARERESACARARKRERETERERDGERKKERESRTHILILTCTSAETRLRCASGMVSIRTYMTDVQYNSLFKSCVFSCICLCEIKKGGHE